MCMSPAYQVWCVVQRPGVYIVSIVQRQFASQSLEDDLDTHLLSPPHPSILACTGMPATVVCIRIS